MGYGDEFISRNELYSDLAREFIAFMDSGVIDDDHRLPRGTARRTVEMFYTLFNAEPRSLRLLAHFADLHFHLMQVHSDRANIDAAARLSHETESRLERIYGKVGRYAYDVDLAFSMFTNLCVNPELLYMPYDHSFSPLKVLSKLLGETHFKTMLRAVPIISDDDVRSILRETGFEELIPVFPFCKHDY
jgi:hypothetical protein